MKRQILTLCLCAFATFSHAQWVLIPEAGLNLSQYTFDISSIDVRMRGGYRAGITGHIPLHKYLYLQTGALLMRNGFNIKSSFNETNTISAINTLQFPVSVVFKTGKPGKDRFFGTISGYVAYNMNGTYKRYSGAYTYTGNVRIGTEPGDDIKPVELGAAISLCCHFNNNIVGQFYAQKGITNLSPQPQTHISRYQFGLSIGYAISASTFRSAKKEAAKKQ